MLSPEEQALLLSVAKDSILHGLQTGIPSSPAAELFPGKLKQPGAVFVTLNIDDSLRGCIGSLEPYRPLIQDVAANAFAAAFSDPRFPGLGAVEFEHLYISISVLTEPEPMTFNSEEDLLVQLVPGQDGLILEDGHRRGTFLPSVWDTLPNPKLFLSQLKVKAGLPGDYWSPNIKVSRYQSEYFGKHVSEIASLNTVDA